MPVFAGEKYNRFSALRWKRLRTASVMDVCCSSGMTRRVDSYIDTVSSVKKQSSPATRHGGAWGERRYSSYSFLASALAESEWSASRPGRALPRGKDPRYPSYRRLGGPQSRSGHRD
jgi:hypothetical protein